MKPSRWVVNLGRPATHREATVIGCPAVNPRGVRVVGVIVLCAAILAVSLLVFSRLDTIDWKVTVMSQNIIDAVTEQLHKASGEILAEIESLREQAGSGQPQDFTRLQAIAQSLDDIVPDEQVDPEFGVDHPE